MRKITVVSFVLVFLFVFKVYSSPLTGGNDRISKNSEPIIKSLLVGLKDGNFILYSKYFSPTLKAEIGKEKFKKIRSNILNKFGFCKSRTYLGFLQRKNYTIVLYKSKFSKFEGDVLLKLILSKEDGRIILLGFWLQ